MKVTDALKKRGWLRNTGSPTCGRLWAMPLAGATAYSILLDIFWQRDLNNEINDPRRPSV